MAYISTITPKAYASFTKYCTLTREDTTAVEAFVLPKGAVPTGFYVLGQAASDAGTTATVSLGTSTTANELIDSYSVLSTGGLGYQVAGNYVVASIMGAKLTADTPVYGIYAETGDASTTGGPWLIKVEYILPGPGETID